MTQRDLFTRESAHEVATRLMRSMGFTTPKRDERHGDWTAWGRTLQGCTTFYGEPSLTRLVRHARWLVGRGPFVRISK